MKKIAAIVLSLVLLTLTACQRPAPSKKSEFPPGFTADSAVYLSGFQLLGEIDEVISEGVRYFKRNYRMSNGQPVVLFGLELKPGSVKYYIGTPGDTGLLTGARDTVLADMEAAVKNGRKVIAGVNGDYHYTVEPSFPIGPCVNEGKILFYGEGRPCFAVSSDGRPHVYDDIDFALNKHSIETAIGGKQILLRNGEVTDCYVEEAWNTVHYAPRTAIGYKEDGTVYVIVIDGRQPSYSNGATVCDMAQIFLQFGCTDAINIDGGGSSTFIIRDVENDHYSVKNNPSDGHLRRVCNTLLFLLPENQKKE